MTNQQFQSILAQEARAEGLIPQRQIYSSVCGNCGQDFFIRPENIPLTGATVTCRYCNSQSLWSVELQMWIPFKVTDLHPQRLATQKGGS